MDVNYFLVAGAVLVFALAVVFVRKFLQDGNAKRFLLAVPEIVNAIAGFVKQADRIHDQLLIDYADEAAETGMDVRLLWVIDRVEEFVKTQFNITIDINWVIATIEDFVESFKQPEPDVTEAPTINVQVTNKE